MLLPTSEVVDCTFFGEEKLEVWCVGWPDDSFDCFCLFSNQIFKSLDDIQKRILNRHSNDVKNSAAIRKSLRYILNSRPLFSVFSSFMQVLSHTTVVLFSNPLAPITDPTNYFYALFVYGFIYINLLISTCFLVTLRVLHIDVLIRRLSRDYAGGFGITSWADYGMFEDQEETFKSARRILGSKLEESDGPLSTPIHLHFNREVARAILLMSSIVYERDSDQVKKAFDYSEEAKKHLLKSEEKIYKYVADWGCKFISIADFQTADGPFVGAFYDIEPGHVPYIVIVFKGTSPQALSEWIVDISFNLEAANDRLGEGFAHQGFYASLFPSSGPADRFQPSPYLRILETIETISKEAFEKTGQRANLYVGGHSLGAGIASLFYARLLESPADLGSRTILRDAYCFGTPRACGSSLASRVEYNLAKPANQYRMLWRISNKSRFSLTGDIVTRVPPGLADLRPARSAIREGSLLSYAAIGIPVYLTVSGKRSGSNLSQVKSSKA
ncbi:Alpha/Beta hydrolase protein [Phakopsora pachyrhizi]|nr:Alpha/Beta hydrolase protein [Phakopsora pachyrhizi]